MSRGCSTMSWPPPTWAYVASSMSTPMSWLMFCQCLLLSPSSSWRTLRMWLLRWFHHVDLLASSGPTGYINWRISWPLKQCQLEHSVHHGDGRERTFSIVTYRRTDGSVVRKVYHEPTQTNPDLSSDSHHHRSEVISTFVHETLSNSCTIVWIK
jgi:hypothetical protein